MADIASRHADWTRRVIDTLEGDDAVVGIVAMGSTADVSRVDEWSDHDIAIIVSDGAEERFRDGTSWLPDVDQVVACTIEHHGGGKAIYRDGHLVEWGVTSQPDLAGWLADDYRMLLDRTGVVETMERIAVRPHAANEPDLRRDVTIFLFTLLHGVGRWRRGERINAGSIIRGEAVLALLRSVRAAVPEHARPSLDRLDGTRRFEQSYPVVADAVVQAVTLPVEQAAQALLSIAIEHLGIGERGIDPRAVDAVTDRLDWPRVS